MIRRDIYPYTDLPAFLFWTLPTEGQRMWDWQAGRCAMCDLPPNAGRVVLDHCHLTGRKRGYLCSSCNQLEARSGHAAWEKWRAGLTPARLLGEDDLYISPITGEPEIRPLPADVYHGRRVACAKAAEVLDRPVRHPQAERPAPN